MARIVAVIDVLANDKVSAVLKGMADKADKAFRDIDRSSGRARDSLGRFTKETGGASGAMTKFTSVLLSVQAAMSILGPIFDAFLIKPIKALIDATKKAIGFGKSIAEIGTLVDSAAISNKELGDSVLDLSAEFGGPVGKTSEALYQAISSGAEAGAEANRLLNDAFSLAIGGVTDISTAVSGLTVVINAYGLNMSEASTISDKFFKTIKLGTTNAAQLSRQIGQVASTAAAANVSTTELFAAIATGSKVLGNTERIVTGLNQALVNIRKPTDQATKEAERLGIEFDATALSTDGLAALLESISKSAKFSSESITLLFESSQAQRAIQSLLTSDMQDFKSALDEVGNSAGATSEATEKMAKEMSFSLDKLSSAFEVLVIEVGKFASENVKAKEAVDDTGKFIRGLTAVLKENKGEVSNLAELYIDLESSFLKTIASTILGSTTMNFFSETIGSVSDAADRAAGSMSDLTKEIEEGRKGLETIEVDPRFSELERLAEKAIANERVRDEQRKELQKKAAKEAEKIAKKAANDRVRLQERLDAELETARNEAIEAGIAADSSARAAFKEAGERQAAEELVRAAEEMDRKREISAFVRQQSADDASRIEENNASAFDKTQQAAGAAAEFMSSSLGGSFTDIVFGAKTAGQAFAAMGKQIIGTLIQMLAKMALFLPFKFLFAGLLGPLGGLFGFEKGGPVPTAFNSGGFVSGGAPGRDSVPALLTPGEFVLPVELVNAIRGGKAPPGNMFQAGGAVTSQGGGPVQIIVQPTFQAPALPNEAEAERFFRDSLLPIMQRMRRNGFAF